MFTGLVEAVGRVAEVTGRGDYRRIVVDSSFSGELRRGASVSLNGACQTVVAGTPRTFTVEALSETLAKTNLGSLAPGHRVNLERPLTPAGRFDGHIVQGHVDGTGRIADIRRVGEGWYVAVSLPPDLIRGCIAEGSIAIDGISLTIARLEERRVTVNIIPTTWAHTTLAERRVGDPVNIELDVIGRYVFRFLATGGRGAAGPASPAALTEERLAALGFSGGVS